MSSGSKLYLDYVITGPSAPARAVLSAVLEAAPVASLLMRPGPGAAYDAQVVRELTALAQKQGVAVLVNDVRVARDVGADGVHVAWSADVVEHYKGVRQAASRDLIVGADAGRTRDDAMQIGEADADYVAFGIPPHVDDRSRAAERQLDLVAWWSEVFEIPCVALDVVDAEHARALSAAGADFVGITITSDQSASDAAARVRAYSEAVSVHEDAT
ncbi:Thiamine monophosphate synthase [Hyphomicrobium sp. GJ21]|uniref:thiamine phosphate synthase n=1 Tax=Hyphomicrobium sp. GJ21 TaxID=113574 RepID=UPI000622B827|nr:thiamine phosphate synthase [Hyphomicrobium sp. GJ21]CEJ88608.1 Thiamine monophosphate synthase [Hyphomicrobium sp. GJ21]